MARFSGKRTTPAGRSSGVPEGQTIIAQRFNVGFDVWEDESRGTAEWNRFQPSLRDLAPGSRGPNVETLGYCQPSLRDEALAIPVRSIYPFLFGPSLLFFPSLLRWPKPLLLQFQTRFPHPVPIGARGEPI